ncbi:hypothetical protein [Burkholderia cepacia]|uniref:hypothetical protein n=1 Tax=Burkholderia cepacia TaxID=292 RepID=UPI0026571EE9|nr:hypothetical protein [Burkholderia cepacia]MDN7610954.1 hypothetical protein [Burkholderia cepacia]
MTPRPALSTPCPLPRKREHAKNRAAIKLASVNGTSMQSDSGGLTPAKAIQNNEAPLARRKPIQMNKALAGARQDRPARLDALRTEVRALVTEISHAANVKLLDRMAGGRAGRAHLGRNRRLRTRNRPNATDSGNALRFR